MENWNCVIPKIFSGQPMSSYSYSRSGIPATCKKYMEIPVNKDSFELPTFCLLNFAKIVVAKQEKDMLVAQMFSNGYKSRYKSLDSIMRELLPCSYQDHLYDVQMSESSSIYHVTHGAVFDASFKPLMMMSWQMKKRVGENDDISFHFKKPLFRLDPDLYVNKEDAIQRFLSGKMLTTVLNTTISHLNMFIPYFHFEDTYRIKVEIDKCPFVVRGVDVPSISVTNKGLLQLAADHIDEVLQ